MTLLVFLGCFCVCIIALLVYYIYKNSKSSQEPSKPLSQSELDAFFGSGGTATSNVDCQNMSNTQLSWIGHKGTAELPDWAGFQLQKCATYPSTLTTNTSLLMSWYSANANSPPKGDPFLGENASLESGTQNFIGNPVANKHIVLRGDGSLAAFNGANTSTDVTQVPLWSTTGSTPGTYVLKFDSTYSNAGNLCVFPKSGGAPIWCIQPQITLQTGSTTTTGQASVNLQQQQQSQLIAAKLKNASDSSPRFALLKDDGTFCTYRGTPGSQEGGAIACK
jgi:hypothetical protein